MLYHDSVYSKKQCIVLSKELMTSFYIWYERVVIVLILIVCVFMHNWFFKLFV